MKKKQHQKRGAVRVSMELLIPGFPPFETLQETLGIGSFSTSRIGYWLRYMNPRPVVRARRTPHSFEKKRSSNHW